MFVHVGQQNYGKVDVVPGLCYVATRFFTLNFVPLIPMGSYIVLAGTEKGDGFQGTKTSLSLKSVLTAWLRAALVLVAAGSAIIGLWLTFDFLDRRRGVTPAAVLGVWGAGVAAAVTLWLTYRFNRAGYDRALQLGAELGLDAAEVEKWLTPGDGRSSPDEPAREPEGWERYR